MQKNLYAIVPSLKDSEMSLTSKRNKKGGSLKNCISLKDVLQKPYSQGTERTVET